MKIVILAGEPATGKSTIMRRILPANKKRFKYGKVHGYMSGVTCYLGLYEGGVFDGTDRLAMSVQPHAKKLVQKLVKSDKCSCIVFEGDRLFNDKFLSFLSSVADIKLFVIYASEETLHRRHKERKDNQSEVWLKGRKTKIDRLAEKYNAIKLVNEDMDDSTTISTRLISEIYG